MSPLADQQTLPTLCYVTDRHALSPAPSILPPQIVAALEPWLHHPFFPLLANILSAVAAGLSFIQLREKDLSAQDCALLYRAARHSIDRFTATLTPPSPESSVRIVINDRLDLALTTSADGVHLGEASLHVDQARALHKHFAPPTTQPSAKNFLLGVSCHSLASAVRAAAGGEGQSADYIFFGPIFATPSKAAFGPPQGLPLLAQVCRAVTIPVFAIGGVTLQNAASCFAAGAHGLAAIRLFQSRDAATNIAKLLRLRP